MHESEIIDTPGAPGAITNEPTPTPQPLPLKLFAKIARVIAEVDAVPKNGHNQHANYHYATYDDIVGALRKPLADRNVVLQLEVIGIEREAGPASQRGNAQRWTRLHLRITLVDVESGEAHSTEWHAEVLDTDDKALGKAYTYCLKYWFKCMFMIQTGDLEDELDHPGRGEREQTSEYAARRPSGRQRRTSGGGPGRAEDAQGAPPASRPQDPRVAILRDLYAELGRAGCDVVNRDHERHGDFANWLRSGFSQVLGRDITKVNEIEVDEMRTGSKSLVDAVRDGSYPKWTIEQ